MCQVKIQTFQGKFYMNYQFSGLMQAKDYDGQPKNNQEQNFIDQILTSVFPIYWNCDEQN